AEHHDVWRGSLRFGAWVGIVAFATLVLTGDSQAKLMFEQQPMKMSAAEALCHTESPASFSVFAVGDVADAECEEVKSITVPKLLSVLAHGDLDTEVQGVNQLLQQYEQQYGSHYPDDPEFGRFAGEPIDYVPNLPITYWGFRIMIGFGAVSAATGALALWLTRRDRIPGSRWFPRLMLASIATPFLANIAGWVFTEMGRQPFVVVPNPDGDSTMRMFTAQAVSDVSTGEVLASFTTLTSVYAVLAVIEVFLLRKSIKAGVDGAVPAEPDDDSDSDELSLAY